MDPRHYFWALDILSLTLGILTSTLNILPSTRDQNPNSPKTTIKLFIFDLAQSKQDLSNIHVSLKEYWAKYTLGSPGILKLIACFMNVK